MKIGIISDTHGSVPAWQEALDGPFRAADQIWHAGDLLYHGPRNPLPPGYNPGQLADLINACPIPVLAVRGNCDSEVDQLVLDIALQAPYFLQENALGRALVTHGHHYSDEQALHMFTQFKVKLWISGHTHEPVLRQQNGGGIFLNPGSPALPKGAQPRRSVALLTRGAIQLFDLDQDRVYASLEY